LTQRSELADEGPHGGIVDLIDLGGGAFCWTDTGAKKRERRRRANYLDAALAVTAVLLCVLLLPLASAVEGARISQISEAIRGEVELARQAAQLRSEIELERARADFLRTEKAGRIPLSFLFNAITEALPAEATLRELTWNGHQGSLVLDAPVERPVELDLSAIGLSAIVTPGGGASAGHTAVSDQSSWFVQIGRAP
jgi:hypothetical protein